MAAVVLLTGCGASPERRLQALTPGCDPRACGILAGGSDEELRAWYVDKGYPRLNVDFNSVEIAARSGSPSDRQFLLPYLERLSTVLEQDFKVRYGSYLTNYYAGLDDAALDRVDALARERERLHYDSDLPDDEKIDRLEGIIAVLSGEGHSGLLVVALTDIAQLEAARGNVDVAFARFTEALALSEKIGFAGMTCQLLGTLAGMAKGQGRDGEAEAYLDRLSRIANASRIPLQAARAEIFRGGYALREGRLNAAYLHFQEARSVCREYKGGGQEIRFINTLNDFYEEFGCWNIIDDLVRQAKEIPRDPIRPVELIDLDKLTYYEAATLFAAGRQLDAIALSETLVEAAEPRPHPQRYAGTYLHHAEFLTDVGLFAEAERYIDEGIRQTSADHLPELERAFRLLKVESLDRRGRRDDAWAQLQLVFTDIDAAEVALPSDIGDEALLALHLVRQRKGDGPELAAAVVRALRIVQRRVFAGRPSAHSYLELQGFDPIRWFVHELVSDDSRLGYEFELAWRGLTSAAARCRYFGPADAYGRAEDAIRGFVDFLLGGNRARLWDHDPLHLVYVVTDEDILRWDRRGPDVRLARLGWSPEEMRATAARAMRGLSTRPAAGAFGIAADLQADLQELHGRLIPDDTAQAGEVVWISADDALIRLPFATFDIDPGERYRPLQEVADIGYLRFLGESGRKRAPAPAASLIVGDPALSSVWRYGRLGRLVSLPYAREEALHAAEAWQADRVLLGEEATKANILANWESADRIYYAGHLIRDPEAPYLSMIPLAGDLTTTRLADEMLEAADVLQADLSGCELVVLSGCSSGAPYAEGTRVAPGLGDAFLDAGADRVIMTLWAIEDMATRAKMHEFLTAEQAGWTRLHSAVGIPRRGERGGDGAGHPYYWGGYVIAASSLRTD